MNNDVVNDLLKQAVNSLLKENTVLAKRVQVLEERLKSLSITSISDTVVAVDLDNCSFEDLIKIFKKVGIWK